MYPKRIIASISKWLSFWASRKKRDRDQCCQLGRNFVNRPKFHFFGRWRFRKFRPRNFGLKFPNMAEISLFGQKMTKNRLNGTKKYWNLKNPLTFTPNFGTFCESLKKWIKNRCKFLATISKFYKLFFSLKFFKFFFNFLHFEKKLSHKNAIKMEGRVKI